MADAKRISGLVNYYAERGRMLHRSLESVYDSLREFLVAVEGRKVVGCVAVDLFWADLAEVKSLAVDPRRRREGIGAALVGAAVEDACRLGVRKLFALTYEKDFFLKQGFESIHRDTLPEKVWRECIYCPRADACDETAMMLCVAPRAGKAAGRKSRCRRQAGGRAAHAAAS
jgi:amino-acid N-acetyltransferase